MKKILALVLALVMLGTACCALAEEAQGAPMYATVGEAMDASGAAAGDEGGPISGGIRGEYFAVVTEKDGKYFRSVANYDEKLTALEDAQDALDYEAEDFFEKLEASFAEIDAYTRTLPIAYTEEFTAEPLTQEEIDALAGKTVGELAEAGWEIMASGGGDDNGIVYTMQNGLFNYDLTVDADFAAYEKAMEDGSEGSFTVTGAKLAGITRGAWEKRFHTDGTVEEEPAFDLMGEMPPETAAIMGAVMEIVEAAKNGEEVDIDKLFDVIEEQLPDKKEEIEAAKETIKGMDIEQLKTLFAVDE